MQEPKVVLLIFSSGKIVLTGAKKREQIYEAYNKIKALLVQHRNEEAKVVLPSYVATLNVNDGNRPRKY